jgi:glycosyltransferase involved in cell wall biosynthesis
MTASISIVTPTFNRCGYLLESMNSVLSQPYPRLEYVIVDGGSTDGTVELLREHDCKLSWWVSEPDSGPWEAINKGFARTTGEVMGWLGSDDLLTPWALSIVGEIFATFSNVEWLTTTFPLWWDRSGRGVGCVRQMNYANRAFFLGNNLPLGNWGAEGFIQQESTFWRRSLWERAGGRLDEDLRLAADFDLWARFHRAGAELHGVAAPLGGFRIHGDQKSQVDMPVYLEEAKAILRRYGGRLPGRAEAALRWRLRRHWPRRARRFGERVGIYFPQSVIFYDHRDSRWSIHAA